MPTDRGRRLTSATAIARWASPGLALSFIVFVLLALTVSHDPAAGVTWSGAPFSDEGWNVQNARNLVTIGTWSTDEWSRQGVTLPFAVIEAIVFRMAGVGIVQARMVSVAAVAATAFLVWWLAGRIAGRGVGILAGVAFATSAVVLYYGRLAFIEPLETFFLTLGWLTLVAAMTRHPGRWGIAGGLILALAIGSKPNALFPVLGILGVAGLSGLRAKVLRRWFIAATGALVLAGGLWVGLLWLPNRGAVGAQTSSWLGYVATSPGQALQYARDFVRNNDQAIGMIGPLILGGALGFMATMARRRQASGELLAVVATAVGWLVCGFGILFLVNYNPNRYLFQLVPPLCILTAIAVSTLGSAIGPLRSRLMTATMPATIGLMLAAPGLVAWSGWVTGTASTLPAIQEAFRAAVPAGATVAGGLAPTLAMRTSGIVMFSGFGMNAGDLYAQRGVRWVVAEQDEVPAWVSRHPAAWAARRLILSTTWGPHVVGLYELP